MSGQRYLAMDGLRGLAALSVVAFHMKHFGLYPQHLGTTAVDLFFIMSGFVVAGAYGGRIKEMGLLGFFKIRMARLYPTYGLSLLIAPVFTLFITAISSVPVDYTSTYISLPFQALYLPTPWWLIPPNRSAWVINGPAWSLFWEVAINIAYAVTLPFLRTRWIIAIIAIAAAGLSVVAAIGLPVISGSDWQTWWIGGLRVLLGFPIGVLLHRMPRPRFSVPFIPLVGLAALSNVVHPLLALLVLLPATVWLSTACHMTSPMAAQLGELSYPLYALHMPVLAPVVWALDRVLHVPKGLMFGLITYTIICVVSWVVLKAWDQPVRAYMRSMVIRRPAVAVNPIMG